MLTSFHAVSCFKWSLFILITSLVVSPTEQVAVTNQESSTHEPTSQPPNLENCIKWPEFDIYTEEAQMAYVDAFVRNPPIKFIHDQDVQPFRNFAGTEILACEKDKPEKLDIRVLGETGAVDCELRDNRLTIYVRPNQDIFHVFFK